MPKLSDEDTDHGIDDIRPDVVALSDDGLTTTETHMKVPPGLASYYCIISKRLSSEVIGRASSE